MKKNDKKNLSDHKQFNLLGICSIPIYAVPFCRCKPSAETPNEAQAPDQIHYLSGEDAFRGKPASLAVRQL